MSTPLKRPERARRPDLLTGPVRSTLFKLALPMAGGMLINSAMGVVDMIWLGRVGKEALAAVSLCFPLHFLIITAGAGTNTAASAVLARYLGTGDQRRVDRTVLYILAAWLGLTLLLMPLGLLSARAILSSTGAAVGVVERAHGYITTIYWGVWAILGQMIIGGLYRGAGDTKFPFYVLTLTVVINAVLDPLMIFGIGPFPRMEVEGAALATALSRVIGFAVIFIHLALGRGPIRVRLAARGWDRQVFSRLWRLAVPGFIQRTVVPVAIQIILYIITPLGTAVVGAFGVGQRLFNLAYLPAIGFNNAAMVMIGQCHAAGLSERTRRTSIDTTWITVSITAGVAALLALFPDFWMGLFSDSAEVVTVGRTLVLFAAASLPFVALVLLTNGYFNAMGQGLYAMLPTVVHRLLLEPASVWLGVSLIGLSGAWLGMASAGCLAGLGALMILIGRWRALRRQARSAQHREVEVEPAPGS